MDPVHTISEWQRTEVAWSGAVQKSKTTGTSRLKREFRLGSRNVGGDKGRGPAGDEVYAKGR